MLRRRKLGAAGSAVGLLILIQGHLPELIAQYNFYKAEHQMSAEMTGPVQIKGEIVDDRNNPLDGVSVGLSVLQLNGPQTTSSTYVNSHFKIDAGSCWSVTMRFSKAGYYSETITAIAHSQTIQRHREPSLATTALLTDPLRSSASSTRVILEKKVPTTQLNHYSGELKFSESFPTRALVVNLQQHQGLMWGELTPVQAASADALPTSAFAVFPSRMPSGKLDIVNVANGNWRWDVPRQIRMRLTGKENGLIAMPVSPGVDLYRGMIEAPKSGYVSEIAMGQTDYHPGIDQALNAPQLYFFIKIGGLYGKGRLVLFSRVDRVDPQIEIGLQMNGSRWLAEDPSPLP